MLLQEFAAMPSAILFDNMCCNPLLVLVSESAMIVQCSKMRSA